MNPPRWNQKGQAMVEAVGALWILFMLFVFIYYLFLMSIDKIRSLDTVYQLARAHEVQPSPNNLGIVTWCFPGRVWTLPQPTHVSGPGPAIDEVVFQFWPHTLQTRVQPWKSVMRVAMPDARYLDNSWPGARIDSPADTVTLAKETLKAKSRLMANNDAVIDAADTALETFRAEGG
jgi:hypothetical protein